jgi:hypothetical protein
MTTRERDCAGHASPPPRDAQEALDRARRHALGALAELTAALHALADAASLATTGAASDAHPPLARAIAWLDAVSEQARSSAGRPGAAWADAVADAIDDEIERWEERSRHDPEARAVLRAFLGVREILWEFGLRPRESTAPPRAREERRERAAAPRGVTRPAAPRSVRAAPARLERVPIEG